MLSLKKRDHSENLDVERRIILNCTLGKQGLVLWTEFICVMVGTGGWLL